MEGKKKKNKKKKGNSAKQSDSISTQEVISQTKPDGSVSIAAVLPDFKQRASPEMSHHSEAPSNAVYQSFGVSEPDFELERHNLEENCEELPEGINQTEVEKNLCLQKEGNVEERIKHLQDEVRSCVQREDDLEERIKKLEMMNQSFALQKDALEERIQRAQEVSQSFVAEKVMELKESRDGLAEENKHLTERILTLESCIQNLEMVVSFYDSSRSVEGELQQKAPKVLEEPGILNEGFTEKVAEIHVQPVQRAEDSEIEEVINGSSPHSSESMEKILEPNENIQTTATTLADFRANGSEDFFEDRSQHIQLQGLGDSRIREDVASVSLDEVIQEPPQQPIAEKTVPISDAPLIGAPFRLISFVTRYVSGADLVDRPKSGR